MGKRDLVTNINFFMNVPIEPDGALAIVDGIRRRAAMSICEAEMDVFACSPTARRSITHATASTRRRSA